MAGWDPRTNYGVGTKVSVPDYSGSFSGGNGGSSGSWQDKWGGGGVDWSKSIPKFDGSEAGQKAWGDSSINWNSIVDKSYGDDRDKLFNQLFGKAKETDKWQQQAAQKWGINPTGDFGMMPGIGAQSGKVTDNLSFQQSASPSVAIIHGQQSPLASLAMTAGSALLSPIIGGAGAAIAKGIFG